MGFDTPTQDTTDPNVPNWEEDGNSPATATGASSVTLTLASTYDQILAFYTSEDTSSTSSDVEIRLNNNSTAQYNYRDAAASRTVGGNEWPVQSHSGDDTVRQAVMFSTGFNGQPEFGVTATSSAAPRAVAGEFSVPGATISDITVLRTGGGSSDYTLEAYGRDIS